MQTIPVFADTCQNVLAYLIFLHWGCWGVQGGGVGSTPCRSHEHGPARYALSHEMFLARSRCARGEGVYRGKVFSVRSVVINPALQYSNNRNCHVATHKTQIACCLAMSIRVLCMAAWLVSGCAVSMTC